jgi:membrane protein YqaA with SNARE-associated domain
LHIGLTDKTKLVFRSLRIMVVSDIFQMFRRKGNRRPRIVLIHQYYRYTGFYKFLWITVKKSFPPIIALLLAVLFVDWFVVDLNAFLQRATDEFSHFLVYTIFFISESFLGMLPPEIFIAWADKTSHPWITLTGLAILAYMGGSVSYYIGRLILSIPAVNRYTKLTMAKHVRNMRKWGPFLIVSSAFLPLPFSMASMAAGIIEYDYRKYLFWAVSRIIRFYLYAMVVFKVI